MTATFQYGPGNDSDYYWRLRDNNNEIVADGSEGYSSESNVEDAIENVKEEVEDGSADFDIETGSDGDYYWHLQDGNNEIVADGSEGYSSKSNAEDAVKNVMGEIPDATVEQVSSI